MNHLSVALITLLLVSVPLIKAQTEEQPLEVVRVSINIQDADNNNAPVSVVEQSQTTSTPAAEVELDSVVQQAVQQMVDAVVEQQQEQEQQQPEQTSQADQAQSQEQYSLLSSLSSPSSLLDSSDNQQQPTLQEDQPPVLLRMMSWSPFSNLLQQQQQQQEEQSDVSNTDSEQLPSTTTSSGPMSFSSSYSLPSVVPPMPPMRSRPFGSIFQRLFRFRVGDSDNEEGEDSERMHAEEPQVSVIRIISTDDENQSDNDENSDATSDIDSTNNQVPSTHFTSLFARVHQMMENLRTRLQQPGDNNNDDSNNNNNNNEYNSNSDLEIVPSRPACPLMRACGDDVETLCAHARFTGIAGSVLNCLQQKFIEERHLLSESCSALLAQRFQEDGNDDTTDGEHHYQQQQEEPQEEGEQHHTHEHDFDQVGTPVITDHFVKPITVKNVASSKSSGSVAMIIGLAAFVVLGAAAVVLVRRLHQRRRRVQSSSIANAAVSTIALAPYPVTLVNPSQHAVDITPTQV